MHVFNWRFTDTTYKLKTRYRDIFTNFIRLDVALSSNLIAFEALNLIRLN